MAELKSLDQSINPKNVRDKLKGIITGYTPKAKKTQARLEEIVNRLYESAETETKAHNVDEWESLHKHTGAEVIASAGVILPPSAGEVLPL